MIGTHKTTITTDNGTTEVVYHSTKVVKFNSETITLSTGGWDTTTTKRRMNQVSDTYGLEYRVFQKNWDWFVEYEGKTLPYNSNKLTLNRG